MFDGLLMRQSITVHCFTVEPDEVLKRIFRFTSSANQALAPLSNDVALPDDNSTMLSVKPSCMVAEPVLVILNLLTRASEMSCSSLISCISGITACIIKPCCKAR